MMLRLSVVVLLGLLSSGTAEEDIPQPSQEALGLLASLQQVQSGEGSRNELREMATLYDLLQLAALQQQQHRQQDEHDRAEAEELPAALPLVAKDRLFYPPEDKDEYPKDKRGSYMSLCHFKICNMGRKRSSYWNPWVRN